MSFLKLPLFFCQINRHDLGLESTIRVQWTLDANVLHN
jgi:hypothetical protein